MMKRLAARGHRVLFVEEQLGPEHFLKEPARRFGYTISRWREGLTEILPRLWIWSPPLFLPGRFYMPPFNTFNQFLLRFCLRRLVKRLGFRDFILWIYQHNSHPLIGRLEERLSIYHCLDEFSAGDAWPKGAVVRAQEESMVSKADVVFTYCQPFYERFRKVHPNVHLIPSATDIAHFKKAALDSTPIPEDLAGIATPRIGYVGSFNERSDIGLIAALAKNHPEWQFVFIGLCQSARVKDFGRVQGLGNIHFLGKRPFESLPGYMKGMNICWLPYLLTEKTRFVQPLKLYDYLASGKPVISTDLPEVRPFSEAVRIIHSAEECENTIEELLALNAQALSRMREIAERLVAPHDWNVRVNQAEAIMRKEIRDKR